MGASKDDDLLRELARTPQVAAAEMPAIAVSDDGVRVEPPRPVLETGQLLGDRFEILGPIGKGGMGQVYRARDRQLGRAVAVKVLAVADADRRKRFANEARAASALQHPNIVAVHDIAEHDGAPYLVLELLEGQNLREKLAAGKLPTATVIEIALQVAAGLAAAHAAGIIHRDLKPENLFVTTEGRVKILDFGLAKLSRDRAGLAPMSTLTGSGAILGTVAYMSPEQLRGEELDHRSDIFAFGTLVVEMLTGRAAFGTTSSADTVSAILRDEVALDGLPPDIARVVEHCLAKLVDRRFQSTQDLVFSLESLRRAPASAPGRARRSAWLGVAAGVVGGGLVAAAIVMAVRAPPKAVPRAPGVHATRLSYRRGAIGSARFGPDGKTVFYSARWDGKAPVIATTRAGIFDSRMVDVGAGEVLAVARDGELAVQVGSIRRSVWQFFSLGRLARAQGGGGMPREVLDNVSEADFAPDGSLAVAHVVDDKWRIEWPIGTVVGEASGWIGQPRVSPDGTRLAYVEHTYAEDDGGRIVLVDPKAHQRRVLADGFVSVNGLAWFKDEVWFTGTRHGATRELRAVDLAGRERLVYAAPGTLRLFDIAPDGAVLLDRMDGRNRTMVEQRDLSWLDGTGVLDCIQGKLLFAESWDGAGNQYGVYVRSLEGGPAVRIADGASGTMSPDGSAVTYWVLEDGHHGVFVRPVGPGESRRVSRGEWAKSIWFPDGKRLLLVDTHGATYIHDLERGTETRAFASDLSDVYQVRISPDGTRIAGVGSDHRVGLYSVGGDRTPIPGVGPGAVVLTFSADASHVLILDSVVLPVTLADVDVATGRSTPLRTVLPDDVAGVVALNGECTPDYGKTFVYSYFQQLSTLYQLDGLR